MGDAKRRQGTAGVSADKWRAEQQVQNTQCQRTEMFQRYALGIFQKYLLLGIKGIDRTNTDASWVDAESMTNLQEMVDRSLSFPSIKEIIVPCLYALKILKIESFNNLFDDMASKTTYLTDHSNGANVIVEKDRQDRFRSFSKRIDLKMHKQICKDCLLFLRSKESSQIVEYLFAFFIYCLATDVMDDESLQENTSFDLEERFGYLAIALLLIEVISIPWAEEFDLIQDDLDDRLKERG